MVNLRERDWVNMRIKCERERLSAEQIAALPYTGARGLLEMAFAACAGAEYVAFGLYLQSGLAWVYFSDQFDRLRVAPLSLFSVVDGQLPKSWRVSIQQDGAVVFVAPPEASDLYFADEVDELEPSATSAWLRILAAFKSRSDG